MRPLKNRTGITIKELKDLVRDLPEIDQYEVWIANTDDERLSNIAKSILQLNTGDISILA